MEPVNPAYFELSWAILSTIGLVNFFYGLMVLGIIGFAPVCLVPIIVSGFGALANGLCYVGFYGDYSTTSKAIASGIADIAWLIQEAGLSFYSYIILTRVLQDYRRTIFMAIFWTMIVIVAGTKISILACRIRYILGVSQSERLQEIIARLHTGYFIGIATVECVSAVFLLNQLGSARKTSTAAELQGKNIFGYLMRSTELRLTLLAFVGVLRAITYNFQDTAQSAASPMNQLDRFAATLEMMFPVLMYIDVLASRLVYARKDSGNLRNSRACNGLYGIDDGRNMCTITHIEQRGKGDDGELGRHNRQSRPPMFNGSASLPAVEIGLHPIGRSSASLIETVDAKFSDDRMRS